MINEAGSSNPLAFLQSQPEVRERGNDDMGQSDFIELMLAQMKNQDPTKPLDPNEFMSQLAQFSTVNGIQELKQSVDAMASMLASDQSIKAATLVGREVMSPGNRGTLVEGGSIDGQVVLGGSATDLNIKVYSESGILVRTISMGGHGAGTVPFKWDGFAEDGSPAPAGNYQIVAEVETGGEIREAQVEMRTGVRSVSLGPYGGDLMLNLENGSSVPLSAIQQIL
ncbi:MAG TPA: flagellar hook assembly protein FlgD [Chromatiaceae bacterium]|nr:flagellar hook assembly protein FlgD [Chromatiaceae bacterium]